MTLEEAVAAFESQMTVHDAVGYATPEFAARPDVPKDMARAPTGEKYVTVTCGGSKPEGSPIWQWFADPDDAVDTWLQDMYRWRSGRGSQVYWRERPELLLQTFVALNQAEAIQDQRLRDSLSVELHTVWCRLLVSAKGPDGKVIDVIEDNNA